MKKKFYVSQFEDPYIQENFKTLVEVFNNNPFLKGDFRFIEFQVTATGTNQAVKHNLNFTPLDAILLREVNGTITFRYSQFDRNNIYFDATVTTSPMTVRALIGTYTEDTINV
jgi:hypothetical protein